MPPDTDVQVLRRHGLHELADRGMVGVFQGATYDWALGGAVDVVIFGKHCSSATVGHGGSQSSVGFGDPETGVVLALICNGKCGGGHNARMARVASAVYEDLGLGLPGAPPKSTHEIPSYN